MEFRVFFRLVLLGKALFFEGLGLEHAKVGASAARSIASIAVKERETRVQAGESVARRSDLCEGNNRGAKAVRLAVGLPAEQATNLRGGLAVFVFLDWCCWILLLVLLPKKEKNNNVYYLTEKL